jgi:hypothetical protein
MRSIAIEREEIIQREEHYIMNHDSWFQNNETFEMSDIQESGVIVELILR